MNYQRTASWGRQWVGIVVFVLFSAAIHSEAATDPKGPAIPSGFLAYPPYNGFAFEAMHLVPQRHDNLRVVEIEDWAVAVPQVGYPYDTPMGAAGRGEADDAARARLAAIPDRFNAAVKAMKAAPDGDAAFQAGKDVPAALRLYTAAAVDFRIAHLMFERRPGDEKPEAPGPLDAEQRAALDRAMTRFQAVVDLSDTEKSPRAVAAAYMLGRGYALRGLPGDAMKAEDAFVLTRTLARDGFPDPGGVAVASFGDQAFLRRMKGDLASAIGLYSEQAVRGSAEGVASLKWVTQALYDDPEGMSKVENIPLGQRLLIAYALEVNDDGRILEYVYENGKHRPIFGDLARPEGIAPILETARGWSHEKIARPDLLAALAYKAGDRGFARSLLEHQDSALAWWLRAKLAIADGDLAGAETAYRSALAASPGVEDAGRLSPFNLVRACAEMTQVQRVRGEFVQALGDMVGCDMKYDWDSPEWNSHALQYVADYLLTTPELIKFVDALPEDPEREPPYRMGHLDRSELRELLARRLVRENRFSEALRYASADKEPYDDPDSFDSGFDKRLTSQRDFINAYQTAVRQSEQGTSTIQRASAWYQRALLTRVKYLFLFRREPGSLKRDDAPSFPGTSTPELARLAFNATPFDRGVPHWYGAYDDALKAAALVPPRSQAYAAILCHAAHWMHQAPSVGDLNPGARFEAAWQLYIKNGAFVPWAASFGHTCPDPDFEAAAQPAWRRELAILRARIGRHRTLSTASVALITIGLFVAGWLIQRRRKTARA